MFLQFFKFEIFLNTTINSKNIYTSSKVPEQVYPNTIPLVLPNGVTILPYPNYNSIIYNQLFLPWALFQLMPAKVPAGISITITYPQYSESCRGNDYTLDFILLFGGNITIEKKHNFFNLVYIYVYSSVSWTRSNPEEILMLH